MGQDGMWESSRLGELSKAPGGLQGKGLRTTGFSHPPENQSGGWAGPPGGPGAPSSLWTTRAHRLIHSPWAPSSDPSNQSRGSNKAFREICALWRLYELAGTETMMLKISTVVHCPTETLTTDARHSGRTRGRHKDEVTGQEKSSKKINK